VFDALQKRMDLCIKYQAGGTNAQDTSNEDTGAVLVLVLVLVLV
jgi:hypothetical protein